MVTLLVIFLVIMIEILAIINYRLINRSIEDMRNRLNNYEKRLFSVEIQLEKIYDAVMKVVNRLRHFKIW